MFKLTKLDYIAILKYYGINLNENLPAKLLRKMVENILAKKLCSCIKKIPNLDQPESRAIGIFNWSVIQRKNLKIGRFTCKKRPKLLNAKNESNNGNKIKKTIHGMLQLKSKKSKKMKKL